MSDSSDVQVDVTEDGFVNTRTAAAFLSVSESTMKQWRQSEPPRGPAFYRGERGIRYRIEDLNEYMGSLRVSTSQQA